MVFRHRQKSANPKVPTLLSLSGWGFGVSGTGLPGARAQTIKAPLSVTHRIRGGMDNT